MRKLHLEFKRSSVIVTGAMLLAFLAAYVIGRLAWKECYTLGSLTMNGPYLLAVAVTCVPALFGKWKYASCAFTGNVIGVVAGELCGSNLEGAEAGMDHYGWLIWGCVFATAVMVGIMAELICKIIKERKK